MQAKQKKDYLKDLNADRYAGLETLPRRKHPKFGKGWKEQVI